ncbi:hypothetical protein AMR42_10525 [Limnothrix sp. PR1529]|nr:hypothetical protein BCR12_13300 [Limnothrix sp. P13C2]PIB10633.1 hypothetical protein AMR42_10525 [Limnothrix sp. PR1529]
MSGSHEKEAVEILAEAYINAYSVSRNTKCLVVILIDDFDLSVASTFDEREYTVNSQLLTGFLMNLADDPTKCGREKVSRIPIIVTGNNFTSLYDPLTRHGRMDFFTWFPTHEQKLEIVKHMYGSCISRQDLSRLSQLVHEFHDEPVSFFDALKNDYLNDIISRVIRNSGSLKIGEVEKAAKSAFAQGIDVAHLRTLAIQRKAVQRKDYIRYPDVAKNNQAYYLPGQSGQNF